MAAFQNALSRRRSMPALRLRNLMVTWLVLAVLTLAVCLGSPTLASAPPTAPPLTIAAPSDALLVPTRPPLAALALATPDPVVNTLLARIQTTDLYSYTGSLSGEWPVTIGGHSYTILSRHFQSGLGIQKATQYVYELLTSWGLQVEYQNWGRDNQLNVIGQITGRTRPGEIYLICAHVDDQPMGSRAPGADDNASGCATVLAAAHVLSQYGWDCTLRFGLWTGEEDGLNGSRAYAARCREREEDIRAVINVDMVGFDSGEPPDINVVTTTSVPGSAEIAALLVDVVQAYDIDLTPEVIYDGTLRTRSDTWSFWERNYPAILAIEDYYGDFNTRYHTADDRVQYLDMGYFTGIARAAIGTLVRLAGGPQDATPEPSHFVLVIPVLVKWDPPL
jgi:hypothetical protein